MPNIHLTDHYIEFVENIVKEGRYSSVSEVVRAGLGLLEQQLAEDALKLEILRYKLDQTRKDVAEGRCTEIHSKEELDAFFDTIMDKS